MNPGMRHMALRLWLTALVGGLLSLTLLPGWQRVMGIQLLILPTLLVLAAGFAAIGWAMNRMGMIQLQRHLKEAAVWERAGMTSEADAAFHKAMALFDSFWISPVLRGRKASWLQGLLARYNLGPASTGPHARTVVAAYLIRHPDDTAVAEHWLEQLLIYSDHLPEEHEAAARVGDAMAGDMGVQRRLMQFFLAAGRVDFNARQTCRQVWLSGHPLSDDLVGQMARMLLETAAISSWALQVYLKAHANGDADALEGVAACVRWLTVTEENRDDLQAAKALLKKMDPQQLKQLRARLEPPKATVKPKPALFSRGARPRLPVHALKPLVAMIQEAVAWMVAAIRPLLTGAGLLRAATAAIVVFMLFTGGWYVFRPRPPEPPEEVQPVEAPVVNDPFTIQVAAYMQSDDAQRYVDQLADKGLAAFWTRAASANRTWYQVKVSHFATKAEAQAYGRALKSKGLINDFYVANYESPSTERR